MARRYAPLYTSIWNDDTFLSLPSSAQRLYLLAFSQPNVQWCGVVPFTARRWATYAKDTTPKQIATAVQALVVSGFVLLDDDTEELWVRSFIKHNVLDQPKLLKAAQREVVDVHSLRIREAITTTYGWASTCPPDGHPNGHRDVHSQQSEKLRVGVDVQGQVQEKSPSTENTNTNTELDAWLNDEANRQADAWLAKDPSSIIDRAGWVIKRARTLASQYDAVPERAKGHLRIVCSNPDCRDGFDYGTDTDCAECAKRATA